MRSNIVFIKIAGFSFFSCLFSYYLYFIAKLLALTLFPNISLYTIFFIKPISVLLFTFLLKSSKNSFRFNAYIRSFMMIYLIFLYFIFAYSHVLAINSIHYYYAQSLDFTLIHDIGLLFLITLLISILDNTLNQVNYFDFYISNDLINIIYFLNLYVINHSILNIIVILLIISKLIFLYNALYRIIANDDEINYLYLFMVYSFLIIRYIESYINYNIY